MDKPSSGKLGNRVAYKSRRSGQCERENVVPQNPRTARQGQRREDFGKGSNAWGTVLTEERRVAWDAAGAKVERRDSAGNLYTLTGQEHFAGITGARACIGKEMLLDPPEPVAFHLSPVEKLIISQAGGRPTLKLRVSGPVTEDIMVFGQAPCSRGRMKPRRGIYLGLLPARGGSLRDITEMYLAVHRAPRLGEKVFIWTRWQVNGWEGFDSVTSAIVEAEPGPAGRGQGG